MPKMKSMKYLSLAIVLAATFVLIQSCGTSGPEEPIDLCRNVQCANDGFCLEGVCQCPNGFYGTNCEFESVQHRLDIGKTPREILEEPNPIEIDSMFFPIDSLYGRRYEGGLIFYLSANRNNGLVASYEDQSITAEWACIEGDVQSLANVEADPAIQETVGGARIGDGRANTSSIMAAEILDCVSSPCDTLCKAAQLCYELNFNGKTDWYLPSRAELNELYKNLYINDHGALANDFYWSSTEYNDLQAWLQFFGSGSQFENDKTVKAHVRAIRAF